MSWVRLRLRPLQLVAAGDRPQTGCCRENSHCVNVAVRNIFTPLLAAGAGEQNAPKMTTSLDRPSAIKCGSFEASFVEDRHLATGDFAGALNVL